MSASLKGIPCPNPQCGGRRHWTTHTEPQPGGRIRRRKECRRCGRRFLTCETRNVPAARGEQTAAAASGSLATPR